MESRVKLFGHPVHPVMIVFPLGLLSVAVLFDVIGLITRDGLWSVVAYYMIGAGIIGGLLAAIIGWLDWSAIPANTRAHSVGLLHGGMNTVVILMFSASWLLRRGEPATPSMLALGLCFAALGIAGIAGWLGGELVTRLGVGVDDGAHLNAPNSLSGRPASEQSTNRAAQTKQPHQAHKL